MGKNKGIFLILAIGLCCSVVAQDQYYFIRFKDKGERAEAVQLTGRSIKRRIRQGIEIHESDHPVSSAYIQKVLASGARHVYPSKWLNGILVISTLAASSEIRELPFVSEVCPLGPVFHKPSSKNGLAQFQTTQVLNYGNSLRQVSNLGADKMHEAGFNGKGIFIAVFDGGFLNANTIAPLSHIYSDGRLKFTYNIVDGMSDVYVRHVHGTNVLSCLAANSPGNLIGTGFGADFALFISEDVNSERLIEEYNWLRAAEMADSLGADIISSSLGYNVFDDASENHTLSQLDGKSTVITKAAEMAARKGILVVNSAGNNYAEPWSNIVFPADGDSVLAVAAVDANGIKAPFSAVGPTFDGRIKPDVAALGIGVIVNNDGVNFIGANGTSFAAPLVSGLAAGIWSADSTLGNIQLRSLLIRSGSSFCFANNKTGYGIPNFEKAYALLMGQEEVSCKPNIYPNPVEDVVYVRNVYDMENEAPYSIQDINGIVLMEGTFHAFHPARLDIQDLKAGLYFLRVSGKVFKLVKH